jgi:hypothetical protein
MKLIRQESRGLVHWVCSSFGDHFGDHLSETGLDGLTLPVTVSPSLLSFVRRFELLRHLAKVDVEGSNPFSRSL